MKKQSISQNQILESIDYFHNNIIINRNHFKNNKGVYYIFFDKFNQSYLLECPIEHINTDNKKIEYNKFFLYTTPNKTTNKNEGMIGYLSFELYNNNATLLRLQITNKNYLRKGLGSNLLHFFEYFARSNNYNFAIATIAKMSEEKKLKPFDEKIIDLDNLKKFYQKQGYTIFYEEKEQRIKIKKDLSYMNIKEIEKNIIKIKLKNENYGVIIFNSKENFVSKDKALEY